MAKLQVNNKVHHIQGILFDKDGTLIELHSLWSAWFEMLCDEVAHRQPTIVYDQEEFAISVGLDRKSNTISHKGPLAIGTMQDIAVILASNLYRRGLPWNEAVQTISRSMEHIHATIDWKELLQPLKGLEDFLVQAKSSGVKMGVVTSDDTDIAAHHLNILNINHFFDSVIGSDQMELPKPFPDIGEKVCEAMDVDAQQVIVIGDTNGDMNLGKNLNAVASIGIVTGKDTNADHLKEADYIIHHYDQLSIE